jgi:predicted acetyltransferase
MTAEYQTLPIDAESFDRLAAQNLEFGLVDTTDTATFGAWLQAESRGFHDASIAPELLEEQLRGVADRRTTGVWDPTAAEPLSPVSTVSSWPTDLSVPGSRSVPAWAISAVTVSPTHRRRGIARAMLESELRTAARFGSAVAVLTVSEATIYSRYGFAPAAMMANWQIDPRRVRWTGPTSQGRVHFVALEQLRSEGLALVERVRLETPGQIQFSGHLWERLLGFGGDTSGRAKNKRAVRFNDADGVAQGFAVFRVADVDASFDTHILDVDYLVAATDEAYAALWQFLIEMDLVSEIRAPLRPVNEAFAWQVSDFRAVRKTLERDHLWTRILDLTAALEARLYNGPGQIVVDVADPLGFASGRILLDVEADGVGMVTPWNKATPEGVADVSLSVNELNALYLGGVSGVTLAQAGRVTENRDASAVVLDSLFQSAVSPWLSIWF